VLTFFFFLSKTIFFQEIFKQKMTFNDGCLGSRNDEERSEMRYVMRIADLVNHQIFERILHFRVSREYSCLSVCSPSLHLFLGQPINKRSL